jgi:hypothetical protein
MFGSRQIPLFTKGHEFEQSVGELGSIMSHYFEQTNGMEAWPHVVYVREGIRILRAGLHETG